ncbi:MAG: hypothetical protein Q8O00_07705, partial [Holophaga sp.]|nr:hypothetical protein [Holophaga sp.]
MNLLAITKHADLVDRLRTAFEGAGNRVLHVQDHLEALASEAWSQAHLILVDAVGDPMDGFRLCALLRGESRILFQNLPIFLVFDPETPEVDYPPSSSLDVDGFVLADDSIQRLLNILGPAVEADRMRIGGMKVPLVAVGLRSDQARRISGLVEHFGFEITATNLRQLEAVKARINTQLVLLGMD